MNESSKTQTNETRKPTLEQVGQLAAQIEAVLNNPHTPPRIYTALTEQMSDLEMPTDYADSKPHLSVLLAHHFGLDEEKQTDTKMREIAFRFPLGVYEGVKDERLARWQDDGEIYARLLGNSECPDAFRCSFNDLFIDHLLANAEVTQPQYIAAFYVLTLIALEGNDVAASQYIGAALITLRETLAPELTEKVLAEMKGGAR